VTGRKPVICVMGVSAAGKSTVGAALAAVLGAPFEDADDLHPAQNRGKMAAGIPLVDEDRWPWLDAVGERFREQRSTGLVLACSALRRTYRDRIRRHEADVVFVHLHGTRDLLAARAASRTGHFMPAALLASQLETLEPLESDERGLTADVSTPAEELATDIADRLVATGRAPAQSLR
jgi:carbohydrate kinase (thermoresistant glucokinase family)